MRLLIVFMFFLTSCGQRPATPREYYGELQGLWQSACFMDNEGFKVQTMEYAEYEVKFSEKIYAESTCQTLLYQVQTSSSYYLGSNMDKILPMSIQIFYKVALVDLTILDSTITAQFNSQSRCGYNDWVYALTKDVSARSCVAGSKIMPTKESRYMNLIKIENNKLFLGNDTCELNGTCIEDYGQKYPKEFYPNILLKQ